ncbi:MAG: hypothetical protein QM599_04585 [Pseudoxanthomonas sp.]
MNSLGLSSLISAAVSVSIFLIMTFSSTHANHSYGVAPVILAAIFSISIYSINMDIINKSPHPLRISFSLYFSLFFSLPGFLHMLWYGFPFYGMTYSKHSAESAAIISLLCVVIIYISYYISWNRAYLKNDITHDNFNIYGRISAPTCLLFIAVSLASATIVGWPLILVERGDRESLSIGGLVLSTLARYSSFVAFLYASLWRGPALRKLMLIAICFLCFLATNNPLSIPRFQLAAYAFSFFLVHSRFGRLHRALFTLSVAFGLLTIFPAVSILSRGNRELSEFFGGGFVSNYASTGDFDGFQSVINVVEYIDATGFKLGVNILSAILAFIPRSLWPNKSPGTGIDAAEYIGFGFTNISAPLPAELWTDFGYLGILFGGLIVGALLCWGDTGFSRPNLSIHRKVLLSVIFGFIIILMRGSLVAVISPIGLAILLLFLFSTISRISISSKF